MRLLDCCRLLKDAQHCLFSKTSDKWGQTQCDSSNSLFFAMFKLCLFTFHDLFCCLFSQAESWIGSKPARAKKRAEPAALGRPRPYGVSWKNWFYSLFELKNCEMDWKSIFIRICKVSHTVFTIFSTFAKTEEEFTERLETPKNWLLLTPWDLPSCHWIVNKNLSH